MLLGLRGLTSAGNMPMATADTAPASAQPPTSSGFRPNRATTVGPPATMTMKNEPGGLYRSAFWMNPPTVAMREV